jgi:hypothetical protein
MTDRERVNAVLGKLELEKGYFCPGAVVVLFELWMARHP